ncbi:unnamed protein product [Clonostachys solani]|uniref:Uncharacterized protein n=1 Tax=Clonostachys solani TaxID=160281 RepID=A0A9N9ZJU8_9HYPO|nr:unnamed protein product [Clonostachys solani]
MLFLESVGKFGMKWNSLYFAKTPLFTRKNSLNNGLKLLVTPLSHALCSKMFTSTVILTGVSINTMRVNPALDVGSCLRQHLDSRKSSAINGLHANLKYRYYGASPRIKDKYCIQNKTSYSSHYKHGLSPLPLFFTSQTMYEEAMTFPNANNRVIVLPNFDPSRAIFSGGDVALSLPPRTAVECRYFDRGEDCWLVYMKYDTTKLFLSRIRTTVPKLLREVEIVFPLISHSSSLSELDSATKNDEGLLNIWPLVCGVQAFHSLSTYGP